MGREKGSADPIRDLDDVRLIYKIMRKHNYHKIAELFIIGCNSALRISDLVKLRFDDIKPREVERDGRKIKIGVIRRLTEKKTKKQKELVINEVGMLAVERLQHLYYGDEYLFQGASRNNSTKPISTDYVGRVFREVREMLDLDYNFSTHSMRKTFGYHAFENSPDKSTTILVLQKLFNHRNVTETLIYIGITQDRVNDSYIDNPIGVALGV